MYKAWKGKRALVTGASSGIGATLAELLAESGVNLVLTARREDALNDLAERLRESCTVDVKVIPADLNDLGAPERLFETTEGDGLEIDLLINNAGFGNKAPFEDISWEATQSQLQVNIVALTELTYRFLTPMLARQEGWILNVASVAAFLPVPEYATYGAGKAYVRNFSEALASELHGRGIQVTALCPGPTRTEFAERAGHKLSPWQEAQYMPVGPCAQAGLRSLYRGRRVVLPGLLMKLSGFFLRFIPRRLAAWSAGVLMK